MCIRDSNNNVTTVESSVGLMHGYPMTNMPAARYPVTWSWDRDLYYWERVPPCSYAYLCQLVPDNIR
eukprot:9798075-Prorocentrum_lima.AAC.1